MRHRVAGALCSILLSLAVTRTANAQARWRTLDDFLARGIGLTASENAALTRGETVPRVLPTADPRDVAVFGVVRIDVPRSFFMDRQRDFPRALRTPTRTEAQLISDPAVAADLQAFDLSDDDLNDLRKCKPNDCKFKLPATEMSRLRSSVDWSAPDARSRAAAYARQRMIEYVTDYRARGNEAMIVFDDRGTVHSSDAFAAMLRDSSFAFAAVPALGQRLLNYPRDPLAGATDIMFWSRDELPHLRRVLRITHATIFSPPETPEATLIVAKQIYADHFFEAGLETIAAVDRTATDASTNRAITVVALRRYRFDHLPSGGLVNVRGRVLNALRDNVVADLRRLKRESEADWAARR